MRTKNNLNKTRLLARISVSRPLILTILFLTLCAFFSNPLHSQTTKSWLWVQQLGSSSWDRPAGMVIDHKDKMYVAGTFSSKLTVGNKKLETYGSDDIFMARFDTKGNIENLVGIGGKGQDQAACISITKNGTVILSGTMTDSCTWNKKPVEGTGSRFFISSVNTKGSLNWIANINISGNASVSQMTTDSTGHVYAAGNFSGTIDAGGKKVTANGRNDVFIIKVLSNGQIDKLISFGSTNDEDVNVITGNGKGEILIAGKFSSGFDVSDMTVNSGVGNSNIYILKFSALLEPLWYRTLTGNDLAQVSSVITDASDNYYLGGSFTVDLGIADTIIKSQGQTDAFLLKYSPAGDPVWVKRIGSDQYDYITGLNPDNIGGIIATGSIGDTTLIDSLYISPKWQGDAAFIAQFTEDGNAIWADYISGVGRNFSKASVLDKNGNLYYYGSFGQTFKKDIGELISAGDQDLFLACYYNCPEVDIEFSGNKAICPDGVAELRVENNYKFITWNDTLKHSSYFLAHKPGFYRVSIIDKKGCRYSDSTEVKMAPRPPYSLGNDTTLYSGDTLALAAPVQMPWYQWMDGSHQDYYYAHRPEEKSFYEYWITFSDSLNCTWRDTIAISYSDLPDIGDGFTPKLMVYPNPATDFIHWKLDIKHACRLSFELADNKGHVLYKENLERYDPLVEKRLDISQYPMATYILRIRNTSTGKVYASAPIVKR